MAISYFYMNLPSIEQLEKDIGKLERQMADPVMLRDAVRMKEISHEFSEKKELLILARKKQELEQELDGVTELLASDDEELRTMAISDGERLEQELKKSNKAIEEHLIERDPRDERDVIMEIRAGAGGDEASLFAQELFRAYSRYAERKRWGVHTISSSTSEHGGLKEIVAEISGRNVFRTLRFESGVHRVQRIPETEKQGRIHTSTVTVAIMPMPKEVDIEIKDEDLRIDTYRASGAGGQHVNKTSSAVRITHLPTNTVVAVQDERSQHKNRAKAMSILRARLLDAQEEERLKKEASSRREQVGTGDRSEKIRTYNFPQDRVTDHRIKKSWKSIALVMGGEMEKIFEAMQEANRKIKSK